MYLHVAAHIQYSNHTSMLHWCHGGVSLSVERTPCTGQPFGVLIHPHAGCHWQQGDSGRSHVSKACDSGSMALS